MNIVVSRNIIKLIKRSIAIAKCWKEPIIVVLLLGIFATLSLVESSRQSATADEVSHIPAGISYVQTGDLRINPQHPALVKYLSGLSSQAAAHPKMSQGWKTWERSSEWYFGMQLLYATPENNADKIVFWARIPIFILSIGLGLVIFFWASAMFGQTAGLFALGFYALDPTMIAFSHLVLFDLPMAFFVAVSAFCIWVADKRQQIWLYVCAGIFLGLALTSKASALAFVFIVPLLLGPAISKIKEGIIQQIKFFISRLGLIYLTTITTIWATYFIMLGNKVWRGISLLPADFIYAMDQGQVRFLGIKPMFLFGRLSSHGEWWYFPGSILAKNPIPLSVVLIFGLVFLAKKKQNWLSKNKVYLIAPIVVIITYAMGSKFNIGVRLIFIIYPFMFILAGYVVSIILRSTSKAKVLVWALITYYSFTLVSTFPNYLAYSNELFGGRTRGYRYLADSNLDIGQGLKELRGYADKHNIKNMPIIYFGEAIPEYYGLKTVYMAISDFNPGKFNYMVRKRTGWLALSTSLANYCGMHDQNYQIRGNKPVDLIAGSILIYNLPPSN